jgi:aryl-alcohol dehydrogenase-like predicted oxidoreductase
MEHNIGVIVYSPMNSGLLTGAITPERVINLPEDDWRKRDAEFQEPRLSRNLKLVDLLREIGKQHDKSPGEVAIAWALHHPAVTGAIVGGRRPDQVERNIGAADLRLSQEEIDKIEAFVQDNP